MKNKKWLILVILIAISGCQDNTLLNSKMTCDDGRVVSIGEGCEPRCVPAGCSNQLCVTEKEAKRQGGIVTTCEFEEEYKCFVYSNCGFYDGECKWEETSDYTECLENI